MNNDVALSWDEASRLDALRALKLLDTPAEKRFDRITHMAQQMFQVPTALISLVDAERQWFKSRVGFDQTETDRRVSFCSHAILQDDVFIVEDASLDPRFANNPLVTEFPFVRFYAGQPLFSSEGKKVGTLCLLDTTPRKFTEEQREKLVGLASWAEREMNIFSAENDALTRFENKLRLAHALEHATDGMISTDMQGNIETINPAACEIFCFKAPDMIGKNIREFIPARQHVMHADFMSRLQMGSTSDSRTALEVTAVRSNGHEFPLEVSFRKVEAGTRHFFTGIVRDITERKNLENAKSEFMASVSHELRTPLTSILGALGMLKEDLADKIDSDSAQLLRIAYLNGQRLNTLINDILDIGKLDAGMMVFHQDKIAIRDLVQEAQQLNEPFARNAGITLRTQTPLERIDVNVDHSRFIQVLTNLISNACKFSPKGETVFIFAESDGDLATVRVIDHGAGIPDEFRGRIFQRFAQAHSARNHQKTGTGLGLNVSKTMIEKMGGRIGYESVEGKGATFFVQIPVAK